jgi:hypothetical protein
MYPESLPEKVITIRKCQFLPSYSQKPETFQEHSAWDAW